MAVSKQLKKHFKLKKGQFNASLIHGEKALYTDRKFENNRKKAGLADIVWPKNR